MQFFLVIQTLFCSCLNPNHFSLYLNRSRATLRFSGISHITILHFPSHGSSINLIFVQIALSLPESVSLIINSLSSTSSTNPFSLNLFMVSAKADFLKGLSHQP